MIREPPCHPRLRHHQPRPNVHKRRRSPSQRTVASPSLKRRPSFHPDGKSQLNLSGMAPQTEARIGKISLFVHGGKAMNNQQAFTKNTAGSRTKQPVQSVSKLASERFRNLIARIWTIPAHRSSDVLATAVRSWPIALWVMQNGLRKLLHRLSCPVSPNPKTGAGQSHVDRGGDLAPCFGKRACGMGTCATSSSK